LRTLRKLVLVAGCGLAAVVIPALSAVGLAGPDSPAPSAAGPASVPSVPPDVLLARSAMAALDSDPRLKDVTLIVSVVDRVAVIGGPVPSAEHGKWAEERVRAVNGIAEVKNRCFVQTRSDPLVRAVAGRLAAGPNPTTPDLPPVVPGVKPTPVDTMSPPPEAGVASVNPTGNPVTVLRPSGDTAGFLLPPVRPSGTGPVVTTPPVPSPSTIPPPVPGTLTATPPVIDPTRPGSVLDAAEAIRRATPRYAGLTIALQGDTLVIGGRAARAKDAWDLSESLRQLPGIGRVVVGEIELR
jgi:hypothetical protein